MRVCMAPRSGVGLRRKELARTLTWEAWILRFSPPGTPPRAPATLQREPILPRRVPLGGLQAAHKHDPNHWPLPIRAYRWKKPASRRKVEKASTWKDDEV